MPTVRRKLNPFKTDPTRTGSIRRRFVKELRSRFAMLRKLIKQVIVDEDALGLTINTFCPTGPGGGVDPSCGKSGEGKTEGDFEFSTRESKVTGSTKWYLKGH